MENNAALIAQIQALRAENARLKEPLPVYREGVATIPWIATVDEETRKRFLPRDRAPLTPAEAVTAALQVQVCSLHAAVGEAQQKRRGKDWRGWQQSAGRWQVVEEK